MSEDTPPKAYTEEEYERNVAAIKDMKITGNEEEIRRALRQTSNDVDVREGGREREGRREGERGGAVFHLVGKGNLSSPSIFWGKFCSI